METCHRPNSRLPRENEPIKDLRQINYILKFLGLFPLKHVPSSKLTIHFWNKKTTIIIEPLTIWKSEILYIPDTTRMTIIKEESVYPDTRHMHITLIQHK